MKKSLIIILFIVCSCSTRIATLTTVSTRNIDSKTEYIELGKYKSASAATIEKAVDDCIRKERGEFLRNVRIYRRSGIVRPIIFGRYKVVGDVWGFNN